MSWLRCVCDGVERLQRTIREPETLRRPVRVAIPLGDLVDVFPDTLKDRQPALRQLGERPRHGDARVRMRAKAAVEVDSSSARRFPTCGNERRHLQVGGDVSDDQAHTSRREPPGELETPRLEAYSTSIIGNSWPSGRRLGCPTDDKRPLLSPQRRWHGCADAAFRERSPGSTHLSRSPLRGRDTRLPRSCFPRPGHSCCRERRAERDHRDEASAPRTPEPTPARRIARSVPRSHSSGSVSAKPARGSRNRLCGSTALAWRRSVR